MWTDGLTPQEWQAIWLSVRVAFWATAVSVPVALGVAFTLERGRFWGRGVLAAVIYAPLVLPPVVTGYLLLVSFGPQGPVGSALAQFGLSLAFTPAGAALAAAVMGFPLIVRSIQLSLSHVDCGLEDAARTMGASPVRVFWHVTLPLIRPGVAAGAILGWAKAMGEFGATITFVSNIPGQTQTIASAIYALFQVPGQDAAVFRLIIVSAALSLGAIALSEILARRRP
ncbi:MAG: molybdate ABC transporter permease subunit [Pseudomonadota bacterium]